MNITKSIIATSLLSFVGFTSFGQVDSRVETTQKYAEVFSYITNMYVDEVDGPKLTETAIEAMLKTLDPHSLYYPKEEVEAANRSIKGSFVGIGIRFQILNDTLRVVNPTPGGPSEKLGIRAGDKIINIDGENIAGTGLKNSGVRDRLLGEKDSKVRVKIMRSGAKKPLEYVIVRDNIALNSVVSSYMIDDETGYIKLTNFSRSTTTEMQENIKKLKSQGMENLIFDLQGNGGGLLYAAKTVADEFLSGNKLVVYSEGEHQPRRDMNAGDKGEFEKGKLIILTDESTASASEIVSGAVQDWDRGVIVGRRTYGKGLVQRPIDLSDGSQIRLTIARYYTPAGRSVQKPYDDLEAYKNDYYNRYLHGEMSNQDSIKLSDSLRYETKITKRAIYGGGGVMPDVFVPIDTTELSDYYRDLVRSSSINNFALTYVESNRDEILKDFSSVKEFKNGFVMDKKVMDLFFSYVEEENEDLKFVEEEYEISKELIQLRLKAQIAQNIWDYNGFYEIYNDKNEVLQEALKLLNTKDYDKIDLAKNK